MPTLTQALLNSGLVKWAAVCFSAAAVLAISLWGRHAAMRVLALQLPLLLVHLSTVLPIAALADALRQRPVREAASQLLAQQRRGEPLAWLAG